MESRGFDVFWEAVGEAIDHAPPLCLAGACVPCGTGLSRCGNACVNLLTDPASCGSCGTRCGLGEFCEAGACRSDGTLSDAGSRLDGGARD